MGNIYLVTSRGFSIVDTSIWLIRQRNFSSILSAIRAEHQGAACPA